MNSSKKITIQLFSISILFLAIALAVFLWPSDQAQALPEASEASLARLGEANGAFWSSHTPQGPPEADDYDFWVVRAYFSERQMVDAVASWLEPWDIDYREGFLVVGVTPEEYNLLLSMGFRLEIDAEMTAQVNQPLEALPGQTTGIPGYPCYRTVEETFTTAEDIVANYPQLAAWIDVGDSWEKIEPGGNPGYDMMVLRLTNSAIPGPKPKLFAMTSIHAREYATAELNTRFAEYMVQNYGSDPDVTWLLDYHEIHLMIMSNPDGRKWAEQGYLWRKNTNNNYCSNTTDRGADLNRNFEFQWGCCGGSSGYQCAETYRGPSPASETETQAVQNYVRSVFPDQREDPLDAPAPADATGIFLDIHSYSELVLWPWGFTYNQAPNSAALQTLGRKLAYFNGYYPDQAIGLYPTDGTTDDFAYGDLGLASYTFEVGTNFFQDCGTFENTILPDNLTSLIYAAKVSRTPYLTPVGPDALNLALFPASVEAGQPVTLTAQINDTRFNNSNGAEPTQNIAAAEYYIDVPPWVTDTLPIAYPMDPLDGSFNSKVEGAVAVLDTTGLSGGEHLVFVRGQDAAGNWGAFSAVFLYISAGNEGAFVGTLTDLVTGEPLGGAVYADEIGASTTSDPGTGAYTLTMPAGTWDLRASAPQHLDQVVTDLTIADNTYVTQNFVLTPTAGLSVTTDIVTATLGLGEVGEEYLRIDNIGNATLEFVVVERDEGFNPEAQRAVSILLVDDDDNSPDMRPFYETALSALGYAYDVFDVGGGPGNGPSAAQMSGYDLVIWFSGDQFGTPGKAGPNDYDEGELATYLDGGGTLFLSSQDYRYDQGGVTPFMSNYLGVSNVINDDGNYLSVSGQNEFGGLGPYDLDYPGTDYSDYLVPGTASVSFLGNNGNVAAVHTENTVFFVFQWEGIQNADPANGQQVLQAVIDAMAADIPWLEVVPTAGSVPPQDFQDLTLTFTAPPTGTGVYSGSLSIRGNDPGNPQETVTVRMIVSEGGAISGAVRLQGRPDHSGAVVTAWGDAAPVAESVTDAAGNYSLAVPAGSYDVTVEMERYLDGEKTGVADGTTLPPVQLLGGDTNDDECVNVPDLRFIYQRLGTSEGDPGWDAHADIDNNGVVTTRDLKIGRTNLGNCSPVPW